MGCDIHCHIEYKEHDEWHGWGRELWLPRSYHTFGLLAGVRGDGPPVAQPRGMPTDLSYRVHQSYREYGDGHTPTWLTLAEWKQATAEAGGVEYGAVTAAMEALASEHEVRVVFWFDN